MSPQTPLSAQPAVPRTAVGAAETASRDGSARSPVRPAHFRTDIEGLRAVAVTLVVLSHAGVGAFAGGYVGVDVFFVISGFVITAGLLRELTARGTVSISAFYARRAVRLMPAAVPVLLASLVGAWLLLPLRAVQTAGDVLASAVYYVNIRLAAQGTDYFAVGSTPSPVQHFWSLAVEEQFYLGWPLLLLGTVALARRRAGAGSPARSVTIVLAVASAASLALCVHLSGTSLAWAYFGSPTRAWELGAGALLAVTTVRLRRGRGVLAAAGLAAIALAALWYDEETLFPGYAALLPVLGTVAVLVAGAGGTHGAGLVGTVLNRPPVQLVGRLSYGWYLWHWPALIFGAAVLERPLSVPVALALCGAALGVAALSHRMLENPVRRWGARRARPWRGISLGAGLSAAVAATAAVAVLLPPGAIGQGHRRDVTTVLAGASSPQRELSQLITDSAIAPAVPANLTPPLATAPQLLPAPYADGCPGRNPARIAQRCSYGDRESATTVVLFGDSHAGHWFPALEPVARQRGWRLVVFMRNECTPASVTIYGFTSKRLLPECTRWRDGALTQIRKLRPQLVIAASTGSYTTSPDGGADADAVWVDGWLSSLRRTGVPGRAVVMNSTPHQRDDLLPCLASNPTDAGVCQRPREQALPLPQRRRAVAAALRRAGATVIEPLPWLCARDACPVTVGNTLVYRDSNHLTTAYAAALAPVLGRRLDPVAPRV